MTDARELAERALHQLHADEGGTYSLGWALLAIADEIREFLATPRPELAKFTLLGTVEPRATEQLGIRALEDFPDTSVVHWDAGGDDLGCGAATGHSTRSISDVSCVPCSRIHDVAVERDSVRTQLARIRAALL